MVQRIPPTNWGLSPPPPPARAQVSAGVGKPPHGLVVCIRMHLVNGTGNSPSPGRPTPGVVKQDKSCGGSVDTTKTRLGPPEGQNEQWREANGRRQRQTIRYRGLVPPPPPRRSKPSRVVHSNVPKQSPRASQRGRPTEGFDPAGPSDTWRTASRQTTPKQCFASLTTAVGPAVARQNCR